LDGVVANGGRTVATVEHNLCPGVCKHIGHVAMQDGFPLLPVVMRFDVGEKAH